MQCELYINGSYTILSGEDIFAQLVQAVQNSDYAVISLTYSNGYDSATVKYEYNLRFNGKTEFSVFSYDSLFTGYTYYVNAPSVYDIDGTMLASGTLALRYYNGSGYYAAGANASMTLTGNGYTLVFNQAGRYALEYTAELKYDEYGNKLFGGKSVTIKSIQYFDVEYGTGDVTVTYVTDAAHPFAEGMAYSEIYGEDGELYYAYTVTYNLNSTIITLAQTDNFAYNGTDRLYGWVIRSDYGVGDAATAYYRGTMISDFIGAFNSKSVVLYALWDTGKTVTIDRAEDLTGLKPLKQTLWLTYGSYNSGTYYFRTATLEISAPSGYVHKGWIIDGEFVGADEIKYYYFTDNDILEISVVFAKEYKVRYIINSSYSSARLGDTSAVEGDTLYLPEIAAKDGYEFIGWMLVDNYTSNTDYTAQGLINETSLKADDTVALCTIGGTQSAVFVAVFKDLEGNIIW